MGTISFYFEEISKIRFNRDIVRRVIAELIKEEGFIKGNLAVIFCSDAYLLEINHKYLNHDYLTDVITFDYCEGKTISGDIYLSLERIKENAHIYDNTFINEFYRVLFHGILHLAGYNDKYQNDILMMRNKENFYLKKFGEKINAT